MRALLVAIGTSDPERASRLARAIPKDAAVRVCSNPDLLLETVAREMPELVVVDLGMADANQSVLVNRVHDSCQGSRILAVGRAESADAKVDLFVAGARGYCRGESEAGVLRRAIEAVARGEMWIERVLFGRVIDRITRESASPPALPATVMLSRDPRLADLTPRELEVVELIAKGATNKEIAHRLAITERTAKAHLTRIYQKLRIDDRVKLALMFGATTRASMTTPAAVD